MVTNLRHGFFTDLVRTFVPEETIEEQWDIASLERTLRERLADRAADQAVARPGKGPERHDPCWSGC